jgi:hypothetical protein
LSDKYRCYLKSWCTAPIFGLRDKGSTKVTSYIPTSGVPEGSIIGSLICNIILDGLNDYLIETFPKSFQISDQTKAFIEKKTGKPASKGVINQKTFLHVVRYADDIIIFAKCNLEHLKPIQKALVEFLKERGLSINEHYRFQGHNFNYGDKFNYLGFRFILPDSKSPKVDSGKYTKKKYTPLTTSYINLTRYTRSHLIVIIENRCMQTFKDKIKKQISAKFSTMSLKNLIDKVNSMLRGFLNYFNLLHLNVSEQLKQLDHLIHRLFYKLLLRKFSSMPKLHTMLKKRFKKNGIFYSEEGNVLLQARKFKPYKWIICFYDSNALMSNIYVDKEVYAKKGLFHIIEPLVYTNLRYGKSVSKEELIQILYLYQEGFCGLCQTGISLDRTDIVDLDMYLREKELEIIHYPSKYELKKSF